MPVDYAQATKLQDFKVDVYKSSDTPNSQPTAPSPTPPSQLSVPSRDTGLGKPNNLPQRQDSLRNDGQYRTTDVTPESTAKSPPPKQNNQLTRFSAREDAVNQAVYYSGFFVTGVIDAINDDFVGERYEELVGTTLGTHLAFHTGKRITKEAIDLINDGVKNGEKLLDDLWRNKPTFEIPQIKIPKFDLPGLPDLEIPKFPDFKFPEISFPKPQSIDIPQPKLPKQSLTDIVKDIDIINCGGVTMKVAFIFLIRGERVVNNGSGGYYFLQNRSQSDIETFVSASIRDIPEFASGTLEGLLEGAGQSGFNPSFKDEEIEYTRYTFVPISASSDGYVGFYQGHRTYRYPYYKAVVNTISIPSGISVKKVLSHLSQSDIQPEVYYLSSEKCLFPLPPPPPPPPPPEDDCCRMGCCPKPTEIDYKLIKQLIDKSLKEQKFTIEVPICKCELNKQTNKWTPKTDNVQMEVFATSQKQAEQLAQLHLDNARQAADLCLARNVEEPIAVIPEWWQVRAFQRPQLVIQYAELLSDNKLGRSRWSVTIPHYNKPQKYKPNLPTYEKGDTEGILVLSDNSKIIVNAKNKTECIKVINALKQYVDPTYLKGIQSPKIGERAGAYKKVNVVPVRCHYFSKGQKDNIPDWSLSLREKK